MLFPIAWTQSPRNGNGVEPTTENVIKEQGTE